MKLALLQRVDSFLNAITMYKVVLYALLVMAAYSIMLGAFGFLFYGAWAQMMALVIAVVTCLLSNIALSKIFRAPVNIESWLITALILFFLMPPILHIADAYAMVAASVLAMASKYVITIHSKHMFNPAAFAAVVLAFTPLTGAIWWVGSAPLLPVVLVAGLLIVRKIRRFALFNATLLSSTLTITVLAVTRDVSLLDALHQHFFSWPILFFASVMVTEPLTTPPRKRDQILYGLIIGTLSSWPLHLGFTYMSPELALVIGNVYAWIVSPKRRVLLTFRERKELARDTYELIFDSVPPLAFLPGQYLEWTLPHSSADLRGNRRYFTIASSPTENDIRLGVKITSGGSSFKKGLMALEPGDTVAAGQLAGDFVLDAGAEKKFVFIAGGIGVTPFRSMITYMIDTGDKRDVILFYANRTPKDAAYTDFFETAATRMHLRSVYLFSDASAFLTKELVETEVPDWNTRLFYLSGPNAMVDAYKKLLLGMGVHHSQIHTDYFPGF